MSSWGMGHHMGMAHVISLGKDHVIMGIVRERPCHISQGNVMFYYRGKGHIMWGTDHAILRGKGHFIL